VTDTRQPQAASPSVRTLVLLIAIIAVLVAMSLAREILAPAALAAVLVIIVHPVRHPLERRGWPRWAATTAVIVVVYLILAALAAMLAFASVQFGALVADFLDELEQAADAVVDSLSALGVEQEAADAASSVLDPGVLIDVAQNVSGWLIGFLTAFFFVVAYVIFMAADAARYGAAERDFGAAIMPTVERFRRYNSSVRRYYVVNASFGAVVAIVDGLALWALGVPAPAVWAILAFVTNFIPNIGFVLGLVPPAILAFIVGGPPLLLAVIAVYSVVNVVLQVLVQPKFVSDAVNLSLTLSFISVVFWTFVIGPLGAILSIPLTLLARALLLDGDPGARWLRWLSGDRDAAPRAGPEAAPPPGEALAQETPSAAP
jgi:AI-2 transport protein TqsA